MVKLTKSAHQKLQDELNERIANRISISKNIQVAREMGDLRENAGYHDAREAQGFNEGRIQEIEEILKQVEIVEICLNNNCVNLGATIQLLCLNNQGKMDCQIVSFAEANPSQRKISDQSPLAQAVLGKKIGEIVKVKTPNGEVEYQILEIK